MNKEINTIIIPLSGKGTRMYPVTKVIEKAMLPIRNVPAIDYIIKEALELNISNYIIVMNEEQSNVKKYLINSYKSLKFTFVYQNDNSGLGKAILLCKEYVNDDYFYVSLCDELFINNPLIVLKNQFNKMISDVHLIGIKKVSKRNTKKYGIVKCKKDLIIAGIEKPTNNPISKNAIVGRYLFNKKIFQYLKDCNEKEIGLSNVIFNNLDNDLFYSVNLIGKRFDIGNVSGYKKAFNKMKTV